MENPETLLGLGPLPPGTVVGSWRVGEVIDRGAFGIVYGAQPLEPGVAGRHALKLATRPQDLRFEREVELLRRIRHPRVPGLYDHGWWVHPSGVAFPYLVMERIDGVGLYEWATQKARSSRQVLRVLADVAGALEATHQAGCVHRDVKGENVLVTAEGHGYLIDFGAGDFQGARTLTDEVLPPGTPYYRSPQALRFQWKHRRERGAHYEPGPADDVYALGVTGYILVTGSAPVCRVDLQWEEDPASGPPPPPLVPPRVLATVSAELDALIVRMQLDEPSARGSAGEVAQALERAARRTGRKAEAPIVSRPQDSKPKASFGWRRTLGWGLAAGVGCLLLGVCAGWSARIHWQWPVVFHPQGDAAAVGDAGTQVANTASQRPTPTGLRLDMPKKPFPGQQLPPCRADFEVEIELTEGQQDTRSCWVEVKVKSTKCKANGYEYKGGCYIPMYPPAPLPQSAKP